MVSTRRFAIGASMLLAACTSAHESPSSPQAVALQITGPSFAPAGGTTTIGWTTREADNCTASGDWSGPKPLNGTEVVPIREGTNTFSMVCTSVSGGRTPDFLRVQGTYPTMSLSAERTTAAPQDSVLISWTSTYTTSCEASGSWSGNKVKVGSEHVAVPGIGNFDYILECTDGLHTVNKTVTLTGSPPVITFTAFPAKVVTGKNVTLHWNTMYASSCLASGDWSGPQTVSGRATFPTNAAGTRDFQLSCSNPGASTVAATSVTATAPPAFPPATTYRMSETHDGVVLTSSVVQHPLLSTPSWTKDLGYSLSYPLVADGRVFVTTVMPNNAYGNRLYALNAADGSVLWGPVSIPGTYFGSGLTYEDGRVFVLMFDGALRAFNASTGAALWSTQLPGFYYEGMPNAYGGKVFVAGNDYLSAVDQISGNILWSSAGGSTSDFASPAVASDGVYSFDGYGCMASASDPIAGKPLWTSGRACGSSFGYTPVLNGGMVYARSNGALVLFNALTGAYVNQLGGARAPSITGTMLITQTEGTLTGTRLSDFAPTWNFTGDGKINTAPVVVDDTAFVGTSGGKVFGVDVMTGTQVWAGDAPAPINNDNESGGPQPPSGPAAGDNYLIFSAGTKLVAWKYQ